MLDSAAMTSEPANSGAPALDPVAETILELLAAAAPDKSISPEEVARAVAAQRQRRNDPPDAWRRYLPAVKQQALFLARAGRLVVLRKGKAVDPQTAKGVIRYKRPI